MILFKSKSLTIFMKRVSLFTHLLTFKGITVKKKSVTFSCGYALFTKNEDYSFTIVFPANTIPAVLESALPLRVAPVSKVIDCIVMIVPLNAEVVPKVA